MKLSHFILFLIAVTVAYLVGPPESKKQLENLQKKYEKAQQDSCKARLYDQANDNAIKFQQHIDSLKSKKEKQQNNNSRNGNTVNN